MSSGPLARAVILAFLLASWSITAPATAQTAAPPEGQSQPSRDSAPAPAEQPAPIQPPPIQPPRPFVTPLTPPATTLPLWTPPVPPPPSQTNIPAPLPVPVPGAPAPGGYPGSPAVSLPGAFAPTIATVRGAALEFRPTARLSEEYSDNFFQTSILPQDNFRTTWGPGLNLVVNGARTFGSGDFNLDMVHDTAPDSGNAIKFFPSLNANLRYVLSPRLSLTLTEAFSRGDEPSTIDQFGIRSGRQVFDSNAIGIGVDWLIDQFTTQAYYRNVLFFNEDGNDRNVDASTTSDSITNNFGLNAGTRVGIDYAVRVGYEFSHTRTQDQTVDAEWVNNTTNTGFASVSRQFGLFASAGLSTSYSYQTDEHTHTWNGSVFGTYGLPGSVSVSGSVGYSVLNSDSQDNEGMVSLNVNVSYQPTSKLAISIGMFRDFEQTAQQGQNFGTVQAQAYFGNVSYQVTPFITTALNATYRVNQGTGTGNTLSSDKETTLTAGASLNWQILNWLVGAISYTYTKETGQRVFGQQTGIGSNDGYTENRVRLSLFASF